MNRNYWDTECECGHTRRFHRVERESDGSFKVYCKEDSNIKRPPVRGISAAVVRSEYFPCECKDFEESFTSVIEGMREDES